MKYEIDSIVQDIGNKYYSQLMVDNCIKSGCNGPYADDETPVRNTAHSIFIFSYLYKKIKESKYYQALQVAANFLLSDEYRPLGFTYICRNKAGKDKVNGLIGQAWVIEALVEAYKVTNDQNYIDRAIEIFLLHRLNEKYGLWHVTEYNGDIKGLDRAFNHQLWYAASGYQIISVKTNNQIKEILDKFEKNINKNVRIYKTGLIMHNISSHDNLKQSIKQFIKRQKNYINIAINKPSMLYKENGYHLFNVYAFSIIKQYSNNFSFFNTKKFAKMLRYSTNKSLYECLYLDNHRMDSTIKACGGTTNIAVNRYGFAYNAPGFELPFIYKSFKDDLKVEEAFVQQIIESQFNLTYNTLMNDFSKNTEDRITLTARIYELVRGL